MNKVKISVPSKAAATITFRVSREEHDLLRSKAESSGVKIGTLARLVIVQVLKAGLEVN